ncbi:MAG: 5-oxoprolinase subunit PxpB [Gammaproteobacteria bacterium]|nr:5-oxoprolinase subunit PxpB [Gammaproteobacteria bacterium]
MKLRLTQVSESGLMIYVSDQIDTALPQHITRLKDALTAQLGEVITDAIPSYTSLLLEFNPLKITTEQLIVCVNSTWDKLDQNQPTPSHTTIMLPVYYGAQVSPDLKSVAKRHNLSTAEVVAIHSQQAYTVCAIGFAPGFAFLAAVDPRIATPRHHTPRLKVPAGSVGIADQQSAVYPNDSPGGWQIIGNCPHLLFDPTADPMMPFRVGYTVKFKPIELDQFLALGGQLCVDWQ